MCFSQSLGTFKRGNAWNRQRWLEKLKVSVILECCWLTNYSKKNKSSPDGRKSRQKASSPGMPTNGKHPISAPKFVIIHNVLRDEMMVHWLTDVVLYCSGLSWSLFGLSEQTQARPLIRERAVMKIEDRADVFASIEKIAILMKIWPI